jgi:hypothetical protein
MKLGGGLAEPQTSMAPKVNVKDITGVRRIVEGGSTLPLLCAAQGFPAPNFR